MTPPGNEPATFRFVAQYLNHCATISGPHLLLVLARSKDEIYLKLIIYETGSRHYVEQPSGNTTEVISKDNINLLPLLVINRKYNLVCKRSYVRDWR
jgi:hypothetical protein